MQQEQPHANGTRITQVIQPIDPSGVPNLDLVLGGGISRGTLMVLVGQPGCGKTTLASQIAFAAAHAQRRVLILTTLSEATSKLLAHLRAYDFHDEALIGNLVKVLTVQQFVPLGLAGLSKEILALTRQEQASLVVLDGFSALRSMETEPRAARQFLFDIGTTLSLLSATTIITTEAEIRDPVLFPEATTADTIIGLHFSAHDERQRRRLEVVKARGAAPLPGLHGLAITSAGIVVYPRLEARVMGRPRQQATEPDPDDADLGPEASMASMERTTFDLPALDMLLDGGLTRKTTTVVMGSGGTGKTLLGLHFALAGVGAGEQVVFLGFHENRRQLLLKADAFNLGQHLRAALAPGGGLTLLHYPPVELDADALADQLLATLDRTGAQRLVIDSVAVVERAVSEGSTMQRAQNYLSALITAFEQRGITALLTKETGLLAGVDMALETDLNSGVAENVLWLEAVIYRERFHRVLSVLKLRFSPHDQQFREFTISSPAGIEVLAPFETERGLLTGIARDQGRLRTSVVWAAGPGRGRLRRQQARSQQTEDPSQGST